MLVTKKTEIIFSVQMTEQQVRDVIQFISEFEQSDISGITQGFDASCFESITDLRISLLNA